MLLLEQKRRLAVAILFGVFLCYSCSQKGEPIFEKTKKIVYKKPKISQKTNKIININGSMTGQDGRQKSMAGWFITFINQKTGISRVAEIDNNGNYRVQHLDKKQNYTIALLSPEFIFSAVLVIPSDHEDRAYQYFKFTQTKSPYFLTHKGSTLLFRSEKNIEVDKKSSIPLVNGIPEGMQPHYLGLQLNLNADDIKENNDIDEDGILNQDDKDLDGDGIINTLDIDDDGDQLLDIFDKDSNGNGKNDENESNLDLFFSQGLEWIFAQITLEVSIESQLPKYKLSFFTKIAANSSAKKISIRGPQDLLTNLSSKTPWDRHLLDDGQHDDGAKNDGYYGFTIPLNALPSYYQVVFFQLHFGSPPNTWMMEFPYIFSPIQSLSSLTTFNYNDTGRIITRSGQPFGAEHDYHWFVSTRDQQGKSIYTTPPILSNTNTQTLPEYILNPKITYQFILTYGLVNRLRGYSSHLIITTQ